MLTYQSVGAFMKQLSRWEFTIAPHPPSPVLTHRQTETIPSQPESFGIKVSPHFNTMIINVPLPTLLLYQNKKSWLHLSLMFGGALIQLNILSTGFNPCERNPVDEETTARRIKASSCKTSFNTTWIRDERYILLCTWTFNQSLSRKWNAEVVKSTKSSNARLWSN